VTFGKINATNHAFAVAGSKSEVPSEALSTSVQKNSLIKGLQALWYFLIFAI
jgi:hypothetical protein